MLPGRAPRDRHRLPVLEGLLPLRLAQVPGEVLAGLTLAALSVPEVMGYTKIAGMPVVTGLYTLLVPMLLFALFGSSRHLVVAADSATAAMMAAGLAGLAAPRSPGYVALAGELALLTAAFLLVARVVRLGFLADFLSRTVLVGFLTGVGIQVALGQVPVMLGLPDDGHASLARLASDARLLGQTDPHALSISLGVIAIVVGARRIDRRVPGALLAVVGALLASWTLDLGAHGVPLIGTVPSGLPTLAWPAVDWDWALVQRLLPTAFGMSVVILAQSAATSRAFADRHGECVREDADIVGLGLANVGAALSGTFVVNGSPTKTQMADGAGARSQLAPIATTAVVALLLLLATRPLAYLPEAALAAVVFLIGCELVDLRQMKRIAVERPWEFWVALTTTATVVLWSVEQGILLAIFLSLVAHTRHGYRPRNTLVVRGDRGRWRVLPVTSNAQMLPGLMVYRFTHGMYYANSERLSEEVQALVDAARPPLTWFCIDCAAVDDVDYSAAETLRALHGLLAAHGVRVVLAQVSEHVRAECERSGLGELLGADGSLDSIEDVVEAFEAGPGRR
ncbi:MAG: SulP family inorganic anion transporter [Planctomycetes bacterium]|nr:SulP family inorganic anion transporter [Planctomycetota bacterium]